MWSAGAVFFGLCHFTFIVLLIVGAPLALLWSWMPKVHVPAALATGAIFVAGADCPLTTWQKACIRRAGKQPYSGGFIEHYLVHPITGGGITSSVKAVILLTWVVPTVVGYSLVLKRHSHRLAAE
jgi:hypothetical protein